MSSPEVTVAEGTLQGSTRVTSNGFQFNTFLGIPFAKAPIGNLRFQVNINLILVSLIYYTLKFYVHFNIL